MEQSDNSRFESLLETYYSHHYMLLDCTSLYNSWWHSTGDDMRERLMGGGRGGIDSSEVLKSLLSWNKDYH